MPWRPTGTVTFLFTDLEGSTRLWEQYRDLLGAAVARHDALLREAVERHGGYVVKTTGLVRLPQAPIATRPSSPRSSSPSSRPRR